MLTAIGLLECWYSFHSMFFNTCRLKIISKIWKAPLPRNSHLNTKSTENISYSTEISISCLRWSGRWNVGGYYTSINHYFGGWRLFITDTQQHMLPKRNGKENKGKKRLCFCEPIFSKEEEILKQKFIRSWP